jgi:hypothetical protein
MVNSGRASGGSGEWNKPFWQQRGWLLSAAFMAVLLIVGVVAVVSSGGDTPPRADSGPEPTGTTVPSASASDGEGTEARPDGCRTDDSDQTKPTAAPKDFAWKANGTGLVPVSRTAGPLKFDGPVWSCYAHTPTGAVFAAHGIADHFSYEGWREVFERQVVPGPGRDAMIAKRENEKDKSTSGQTGAGGYAGFSILSYSKDEATVMLLIRGPSKGQFGAVSLTLQWHEGDWKIAPDPDGTVYSGMVEVSGTNGFVMWEA